MKRPNRYSGFTILLVFICFFLSFSFTIKCLYIQALVAATRAHHPAEISPTAWTDIIDNIAVEVETTKKDKAENS